MQFLTYGPHKIAIQDSHLEAEVLRNLILRIVDSERPTWLPIPRADEDGGGTVNLLITAGVPIAIAVDEPAGAASEALHELLREFVPEMDDKP